jgi:DNA-binding PadR family transcriptional regulator
MTDSKMLYEDVLNELMLTEDTPSHDALVRWSDRYPGFAKDLEMFFATWVMQDLQSAEPEIDEEKIVQQTVSRGLDILRRQGRLIEKAAVELGTPVEYAVLSAIELLHGDADLVSVTKQVSEMSEGGILPGSTVSALGRLEERGLIQSWDDETEAEKQGDVRQYFSITLSGERALAHAKETAKVLGDLLGDFA